MGSRSFTSAAIAAARAGLRLLASGPAYATRGPAPALTDRPAVPLPPDELAFVRAILADPADSLPRLVYADWLEDRGDPRGEFLRLATRYRDELRDFSRDRPAILARLDELRPLLPAMWRTAFDIAGRFYLVWPRRRRDRLAALDLDEPLRVASMPWHVRANAAPGDYLYVLTLIDGRPFLVSRMRVVEVGPVGQYRRRLARTGYLLREEFGPTVMLGDEGLPIRLGPFVPDELLRTVEFHKHNGRRGRVKLDADGRVHNHGSLYGGSRLTDATALRFDALFNGWA
jgi:uncharacterized protein (TIGR02996 family)